MEIKRIFFDSGHVLVYPSSGHWFYTKPYYEYCAQNGIKPDSLIQKINFLKAYKELAKKKKILTIEEELRAFMEFYTTVFHRVSRKDTPAFIRVCAESNVLDNTKYAFFTDVKEKIPELSKKYALGIISDAWPSLMPFYERNGLLSRFDPFIISSLHGHTKEGHELFKIALDMVPERPEECLFIDDSEANLDRAMAMGMKVALMDRKRYVKKSKYRVIHELRQIEAL
jgi:putative hydrolase of the HAD superfamily